MVYDFWVAFKCKYMESCFLDIVICNVYITLGIQKCLNDSVKSFGSSDYKWRNIIFITYIRISPGIQEYLMPACLVTRVMQSCITIIVDLIQIAASIDKCLHGRIMSQSCRQYQWCVSRGVLAVHKCPTLNQSLKNVYTSVVGSYVQRCEVTDAPFVYVAFDAHKVLNNVNSFVLYCCVEWGVIQSIDCMLVCSSI